MRRFSMACTRFQGVDGQGYVLEDLSGRMSPGRWAQANDRDNNQWKLQHINMGGQTGIGIDLRALWRKMFGSHKWARAQFRVAR
jgi:hypothetical protein